MKPAAPPTGRATARATGPAAPAPRDAGQAAATGLDARRGGDHGASHEHVKALPVAGERLAVTIESAAAGERLDRILTRCLAQRLAEDLARNPGENRPELSRSRLRSLIEAGWVELQQTGGGTAAGTITDPSYRVKPGQIFAIFLPEPEPAVPAAQALPLTIVYEDAELLVIDKPAGMVVHPAPGNPDLTLVNALIAHCGDSLSGIGGVRRPGIVHRIDKQTSGLMVVAKTDRAHAALSKQFAAHSLDRAYLAVVWGAPEPPAGEVSGAIGRDPHHRKRMAVVARGGKAALTRYKLLRRFGHAELRAGKAPHKRFTGNTGTVGTSAPVASLLECRLATGRTHQIRVHMAWLGHPLLGDDTYTAVRRGVRPPSRPPAAAAAAKSLGRQALHASRIGFLHPTSRERLVFESSLPVDIKELISKLEVL